MMFSVTTVMAQESNKKENIVSLSSSLFVYSSHNQLIILPLGIDYMRAIDKGFYWGASLDVNIGFARLATYDWDGIGSSPYRNSVSQNIYKLSAMGYYDLRIAKWLSLRFGVGVGVGVHHIRQDGDSKYSPDNPEELAGKLKILPYFDAEIHWVFKMGMVELSVAPLIFSPSKFSFSPVKLGAPTDVYPYHFNFMPLAIGIKF